MSRRGPRILVHAGTGNDTEFGSSENDVSYGDDGDDFITAGAGNDVVIGGLGKDNLQGGNGHDLLAGGTALRDATTDPNLTTEKDTLTGGVGKDVFIYGSSGVGLDTYSDYKLTEYDYLLALLS
jgi:Ca2+-binding RTX toxin-like protein